MYKKIQLLICLVAVTHLLSAQDSVLFKINYLPNHQYKQSISMSSRTEMSMNGDDSVINAMKEQGVSNPMIINNVKNIKSVATTGNLNNDGKFLIHMKSTQLPDSTEKSPMLFDAYGYGTTTGLPQFDSLASNSMDKTIQKQTLQVINSMFKQIEMPDKKMGVGEEYIRTSPFHLPVMGMNMNMTLTEKYKLLSLNDSIANFSIYMNYTIDMDLSKEEIKNLKVSGSGEGKGILLYNRKYSFPSKYNMVLNFDIISGQLNNTPLNMEVHMQMNSNHTTEISEL